MGIPLSEFVPLSEYEAREGKPFKLRFPGTPFVYKARLQNALVFVRFWTAKNTIIKEIQDAALESAKSKTPGLARLSLTASVYRMVRVLWDIGEKPAWPKRLFFKIFFFRFMGRNIDIALETWEKVLAHSGRLLRFNKIPPGLRSNSGGSIQSDWARNFYSGFDPNKECWITILGAREIEKEHAIAQYLAYEEAKEGKYGIRK